MAKKKNKGQENLIPILTRTPEERREQARKAGIASGEAKRRKKDIRLCLDTLLAGKVGVDDDGNSVTGAEALAVKMYEKAMAGNVEAMKLLVSTSSLSKDRELAYEIEKAKLKLERDKFAHQVEKDKESDPTGKDIVIKIGGYEKGWEE